MATITRLEDLQIWQLARVFAKDIGRVVDDSSFDIETGLRNQMKNSSGSVMYNIAEGFGRGSKHEFVNYLTISHGSAEECRSQLYRSLDRKLIHIPCFEDLLQQAIVLVKRITALIHYLNRSAIKGNKFKDHQ